MIENFGGPVFDGGDVPVLIWTFFYLYVLLYGPWIIVPVGLFLVVRLFFLKKPTRRQAVVAYSVLVAGVLLAILAWLLLGN